VPNAIASNLPALLSTAAPSLAEQRFALVVVVVSTVGFAAAAPFARQPLPPQPAFIGLYQSSLALNDLLTAALLFGQYQLLRTQAMRLLASAYLFTALLAIVHALSFPGLLAPEGLLGAGTQTTAWLYMLWHGAFPLAVIGYGLLSRREPGPVSADVRSGAAIAACVLAVCVLVIAAVTLTTTGAGLLPPIMVGHRYAPAMVAVVACVWGASVLAVGVLWRYRQRSVLDLWLLVVMCAWVFDIGLSAVLNGGRFDLGFYVGRLYGLLASCLVLLMLLAQTLRLHAQLARAHDALREMAERDGLTGLFNRRRLDEALRTELLRAARERQPLSLLLVDVDHFKRFNDTHGHVAGDACLRAVARQMGRAVGRPGDVVARFGGEEFAVLLPATDAAGALQVGEHLRRYVASGEPGDLRRVTVSVGVATMWPDACTAAEQLVDAADRAPYAAKAAGRDRVAPASANVLSSLAA
jgi:diguanylate cyclase (GGDEF)-like protein